MSYVIQNRPRRLISFCMQCSCILGLEFSFMFLSTLFSAIIANNLSEYLIIRHYSVIDQSVNQMQRHRLFFFNPIKSKNREQPAGWQNSFAANIDSSCNPIGSPLFFKSIWYLVCVRLRRKENNACYSFFRHKSWLL